ncbi:carcinine hydrolase/isopenicillin-N N-acyltransferase family protein [Lacihabitans lacunae]|uniref:Carcinine hydrolase/isopenicillin-N N-acyltransferase family protein n=1 Tax=Lacihabitans lacunae TaxID=1028214 RepID=A0ABV7YQR3_9BACT
MVRPIILMLFVFGLEMNSSIACSVLYYVDSTTGKVYVVNNEDYWYDVNAFIKIEPKSKKQLARLWYGWDKFAQGGVNEAGLFFDAAVAPEQPKINGYGNPKSNLGDDILANCKTIEDALAYLEKRKIALTKSHMMFGDKSGKAVIVEWVNGEKKLHWVNDNKLIMTNYLLSDTSAGNYPCYRYESIKQNLEKLKASGEEVNLLKVGNTIGQAVQPPKADENNQVGGTVYTSFINLTDMEFVLSYKLSNKNVVKLNLNEEFLKDKGHKIKLIDK